MRIRINDKEVDVDLVYDQAEDANEHVSKDNHVIVIEARGDFVHHLIEGIVKALKMVQEDNPHLRDI